MQKQNQTTTTKYQHYPKSFREHKRRYTSQLTLNGHHDLDTQTRTWCYMNTKYKASHFETVYKETIKNCQISLYIKIICHNSVAFSPECKVSLIFKYQSHNWTLRPHTSRRCELRELKQWLCINLEGWDGKGDGREVQERGDICTPMADSCWYLTENNKCCKAIILQLKSK